MEGEGKIGWCINKHNGVEYEMAHAWSFLGVLYIVVVSLIFSAHTVGTTHSRLISFFIYINELWKRTWQWVELVCI